MFRDVVAKLHFVWYASGRVKAEHGVGRLRQFTELFALLLFRQLGPKLYYEARLWRGEWPLKRAFGFMNTKRYVKRVAELNPPAYRKLSQHKLAEKALLRLLAIPTPTYVGFFHRIKGVNDHGEALCTERELVQLLQLHNGGVLCFKPAEGSGGTGFAAVRIIDAEHGLQLQRLNSSETVTISEFVTHGLSHADGYLIEEYFIQHSAMAEMNPSSVNTLRIWARQIAGDVTFLGALLRLGRAGSLVDSSAQGGLIAYIDLARGVFGKGRNREVFPTYFDNHPDTGAKIAGRPIPHWQECIALAKRTIRSFPMAHFAGLDMAIGPDGPVIIEMNLEPDKISVRIFDRSHTELLG